MHCPYCPNTDTRVVDSRVSEDGGAIRRRRTCAECGRLDGCVPPRHMFVSLDAATRGRVTAEKAEAARAELAAAVAATCRHGVDRARVRCGDCDRAEKKTQEPAVVGVTEGAER